jgi:hypothetical protein
MSVTNFLLKTLRELDRVFVCFGSQYSASVRRASLGITQTLHLKQAIILFKYFIYVY